jgi:hypothetical protein
LHIHQTADIAAQLPVSNRRGGYSRRYQRLPRLPLPTIQRLCDSSMRLCPPDQSHASFRVGKIASIRSNYVASPFYRKAMVVTATHECEVSSCLQPPPYRKLTHHFSGRYSLCCGLHHSCPSYSNPQPPPTSYWFLLLLQRLCFECS